MCELVAERTERRASWRTDGLVAVAAAGVASVGWALAGAAGIDLVVRSGAGTTHVDLAAAVVVLAGLHLAVGAVVVFGLRLAHAPRENA